MWLRTLVATSLTSLVWSQHTHARQKVQHNGASYEWGWQLSPVETSVPVEQYYVQLPQPVQQIQYPENVGVLHGAEPLNGGDAATVNYSEIPVQIYQNPSLSNNTQIPTGELIQQNSEQAPVDIFLLHQQYPLPQLQAIQSDLSVDFIPYTNIQQNVYGQNTAPSQVAYNIQTEHPEINKKQTNSAEGRSNDNYNFRPVQKINTNLNHTSVVQVFKDHNCSNDDYIKTLETPVYSEHNVDDHFGAKSHQKTLLQNEEAGDFKIEKTRANTNNEGYYYYSTETPHTSTWNSNYNEENGILRLVASTQDLISNDDLLKINLSAEKHSSVVDEDYIKPRPRYNLRTEESRYNLNPRNQITVKAKIRNIENTAVENSENNVANDETHQNIYDNDKFMSPIVVQESRNDEYREGVVNTLVSTVSPYIDNGYEILSITRNSEQNYTNYVPQYLNQETIYITPRPLGQKYLAPITVALRLLNANHSEVFNSIDDHDTSDSELIEETVKSPSKERTVVEVQQSIPLDITHINDVEVHEYWDEGRSNSKPFDVARTLYNTYMEVLQATKENNNSINETPSRYDTNHRNNNQDNKDNLEPSENIQSEVQVKINGEEINNKEYKNSHYYNNGYSNRNVIQPIVIEKEVPVTQYVDRYIEKSRPEPIEVKYITNDRPVPVPVTYEKVVEKPVEVTKYVDKPYPFAVPQPYPVRIPFPVEQKVYIDRPVHVPYQVEKFVEKRIVQTVPVPTPVAVPVKVQVPVEKPIPYPVPIVKPVFVPIEKPVPVEKIVHKEVAVPYPVEQKVLYPVPYEKKVHVPYPVEKRVPVTVDRVIEKPVPVTQIIEKSVQVPVPFPVHVVKHYPVDRVVEKRVPYLFPVDRVVEKKVPVNVPYPVEKVVEKVVEKPVVVTKYVDKPYPVETKVPYIFEKIVEKRVPYAVHVPYTARELNSYGNNGQESQNHPQYLIYQDQSKQIVSPNAIQNKLKDNQQSKKQEHFNQYHQYLNERHQRDNVPFQTAQWGNLYASSYKHLNATPQDSKELPKTPFYITYQTNQKYYGPPPLQAYDSLWEKNNKFLSEAKLKRTDRTPKLSNLRIEYGFKPPLIPSTEVDLDGRPINKETET